MDTGTYDNSTSLGAVQALIRRISRLARSQQESIPTRIRGCGTRQLGDPSIRLLETLPPTLRLVALRGQFPRVLNRIADAWHSPKTFTALIDSLLLDERGKRQGFPFEVMSELTELREYYFAMVHPEAQPRDVAYRIRDFR
jgi:hypothetical protein